MEGAATTVLPAPARARGRLAEPGALRSAVMACYGVLGALLAAYIASVLVGHPHGQLWETLNNWPLDSCEVLAAILCLARGLGSTADRRVAMTLGFALLAWAGGDVVWTLETRNGGLPPVPSLADGFYLSFYPLAYVGLMLLMRRQTPHMSLSRWLDGITAGSGAAALSAAFAFDTIFRYSRGPAAEFATNLAYPIADLMLLALAVGGLAMIPTWRNRRWLILVLACVLDAVGDTIYLYQSSAGTYKVGTILDATWPAAILLMSLAIWQPAGPTRERRSESATPLVIPVLATLCSLFVLAGSSLWHVSRLAVVLASIAMLTAGLRSVLALGELRTLTDSHRRQALTDDLTRLGNRRHLLGALDDFFAADEQNAGEKKLLALLLIDLDHFKEINDSFGHPVGDQILLMLGPRLKSVLRETDVLARLGGDEFGVMLTGADAEYATTVAERLTTEIEQPFLLDVAKLHVGVSIGIALAPTHAGDSAELLRCADVAMYRAKAAQCPFEMYASSPSAGHNRLRFVEQLRDAVAQKDLQVYFQPLYELASGKMLALEALLRWPHPELGLLLPGEFLPLAEEANLMQPLTDFVLESALKQCAAWRGGGNPVYVSVNVSAANLLDDGLADRIRFMLARNRLGAESLVLEVTEAAMMTDRQKSQRAIQRLQQLGVVISVDDFGTGFSSFAYLSELEVGELKIDRELTKLLGSGAGRTTTAVVRATIELGHSLGLRVVAEGVEDADTYSLLVSLGCDLAQGYFMCRPVPAGQVGFSSASAAPRLNVISPVTPLARPETGAV